MISVTSHLFDILTSTLTTLSHLNNVTCVHLHILREEDSLSKSTTFFFFKHVMEGIFLLTNAAKL